MFVPVGEAAPERIAELIYLEAFVPSDGQRLIDIVDPQRRSAMETLVESEGDGWLLPRIAPPPWEQLVQAWQVTDPADLALVLPRLRGTPFGHFRTAVRCENLAAQHLPRTYIRCTRWPAAGFDRFAALANETLGWRLGNLDASHVPFITSHDALTEMLLAPRGQQLLTPSRGKRRAD